MKLFVAISVLVVLASAKAPEPLYPQRVYTRTLLYNTPWTDIYCLEDGSPGSAQGIEKQQYDAIQPCSYGAVSLMTGGDSIEFGAIGRVAAAVADLGEYKDLGRTLNAVENLPYASNFLGISVCGTDLCAVTDHSGPGQTVTRHKVHFNELLTTTTHTSITPKMGHVYIVRLTDEVVTTLDIVNHTTLLAKFTVNQAGAGIYHISWTVFYGDPGDDAPDSGDGESSSRHRNDGVKITVAEALSISALTLSAVAIAAVISVCIVFYRARSSSGYTPINR